MSRTFPLLACAAALHAGAIRGVVVENQTSRVLANAQVELEVVGGTAASGRTMNTDRFGNFAFAPLAAGFYLIRASRAGFMPMEYGQKRWNSAGEPVTLAADGDLVLTIRLPRYGGIVGTILDENYVGWLQGEVLAYRYGTPPALVARGRSDERGIYRISGLEPGMYLVRSAPMQSEGESFLPTFSQEAIAAAESRPVEVYFEQDTTGVDVRPRPGRLFTVTVTAVNAPPGAPMELTLASEMGRQTVQGAGARFTGLSPGVYEVYARTLNPAPPIYGGYLMTTLDHDGPLSLPMTQVFPRTVEVNPKMHGDWRILARRKDLAGVGEPEALDWSDNRASIAPGRWELKLEPESGYYVSGFSAGSPIRPAASRPDGWNEIAGGNLSPIRFTLSSAVGAVGGVVKVAGAPAVGAPVYLEAYDPAARIRLLDLLTVRTGARGDYRFDNLAPGLYRVLSTFEYNAPDSNQMEQAGARSIEVSQAAETTADLDLYGIP
jgi:hypothetical protein